MQAAGHLGITAADSELMQIGGSHVFVTRRYDRRIIDGRWHRIHQEDLCQALSVAPEKKYQRADGGPGVARIGQLFRALPQPVDRRVNAEAFFEGLMFNTIIQATDAHAKNYSLLLVGDRAVLAPLYDLITDAPYARAGQILQAAMAIGGEYSYPGIGRARALAAGRALGVDVDTASDVIERLSADVTAAFDEARRALPDHDLRRRAAHIVDAIANLTGPLRPAH